ncbi:MAG: response regulator transcription factor [Pirellulales bacterium]|nr:response regulator transcription factor [Pirellulales bacterium]
MAHILVVEDEQHLAEGLKFNLDAEGYRVTVVGDGPKALKTVEKSEPPVDLVILDLMLPGMSGYAVCQSLREEGNNVPVLMLTARKLPEDRARGFDVGTDQYMEKPFDLDELLSRCRNLLNRARPKNGGPAATRLIDSKFSFGRADIDFDSFQVTVAGKRLRLTTTEMKLLRYFVENEGSVVTRSELLEHVWGFSTTPTTRTVDNFVRNLRKYFEEDPANPRHFLTVRAAGYRFVAAGEQEGE